MRFWVFADMKLAGPYEAEEVVRLPAFSERLLVRPQGGHGQRSGGWEQAGNFAEFSLALAGNGAPASPASRGVAGPVSLPEKVVRLELMLLRLQDEMRLKEAELASIRRELDEKRGRLDQAVAARERAESELEMASRSNDDLRAEVRRLADLRPPEVEAVPSSGGPAQPERLEKLLSPP